jgi:7-cyano-7-deazaguanine synthase
VSGPPEPGRSSQSITAMRLGLSGGCCAAHAIRVSWGISGTIRMPSGVPSTTWISLLLHGLSVEGLCPILTENNKHRGRFKWKKYSRHKGNLQDYWTDPRRKHERHRKQVKSVLLFSGGLDSTVLLADRLDRGEKVTAVSFDYGQTHRGKELAAAKAIANHYGVEHRIVGMSSVVLPSALTGSYEIPNHTADKPDSTTVPARNMIFLSIGAAIAESEGAKILLFGANLDDHKGFVDCRPAFIDDMRSAIELGTDSAVTLSTPYLYLSKQQIVQRGVKLGAPMDLSWSCYRGGDEPCLNCGACHTRKEAFELLNQ